MTKQEILEALEGLKDFVNHVGKQAIDGIKAGILGLEDVKPIEAIAEEAAPAKLEREEEKPEKFVSGGRFAEKETEEDNDDQEEQEAEEGQKLEGHETKKKVKAVPHGTKKKK